MDKIFRKSFRVEVTIAAKDLEHARELYELYDITETDKDLISHILNVEVVEDDYEWEEDIVDADGKKIDIKYH
tara:strand:+ start:84 stop:302 length:219 start_codon:yes stop_codon:yes gene_type:complete